MKRLHTIVMDCHINKLPENHQVTIIHLINHLASHTHAYQQHVMDRLEKISRENPYTDEIQGFNTVELYPWELKDG